MHYLIRFLKFGLTFQFDSFQKIPQMHYLIHFLKIYLIYYLKFYRILDQIRCLLLAL